MSEYLPVSWVEYHEYTRKLSASLLQHADRIDSIVAISRGGLPFGRLLSDFLRIPISTITIQSYTDFQKQGEQRIVEPLKTSIKGKHILLADDVSDSGKTLVRALTYLKHFKPKKITTVTLFYKPRSVYRPDFYAKQTTKWILFPYEPTEMIYQTIVAMHKEGKSKNEIQKFLESLGYSDDQIRFVRKYFL